jgi:hypothetical protein
MNRKAIGVGMVVTTLIVIAFVSLVSADHYAVNVTTGNTTWGIDRTTLPISFDMAGTVSGNGTMILDHNIDLAGVGKNGLIHTHPGEVTISEILDLKSTTAEKGYRPGRHIAISTMPFAPGLEQRSWRRRVGAIRP